MVHRPFIFASLLAVALIFALFPFIAPAESCQDLDGGFAVFAPSYVSFGKVSVPDRCEGPDRLVEYTCQLGRPFGVMVPCECVTDAQGFGACRRSALPVPDVLPEPILEPKVECVDSDGGLLSYQPGYVLSDGVAVVDKCTVDGNVAEYVCVNGSISSEVMPCMKGCRTDWQGFGACVPTSGGGTSQFSAPVAPGTTPPASPPPTPGPTPPITAPPSPGPTPPGPTPPIITPPSPGPTPPVPVPEFGGLGLGISMIGAGLIIISRRR